VKGTRVGGHEGKLLSVGSLSLRVSRGHQNWPGVDGDTHLLCKAPERKKAGRKGGRSYGDTQESQGGRVSEEKKRGNPRRDGMGDWSALSGTRGRPRRVTGWPPKKGWKG